MASSRQIELLSPAKDIATAKSAIIHGADAVYIGAKNFGARKNASNTIDDIKELCDFAHFYFVKIFITVNTILFDNEIKKCEHLIWELYDAGVDAIIIQDLGILKLNLPPIEFHASTQCNIRTLERAKFIDSLGFNQMVLARELSLKQITEITKTCQANVEIFIHGALCVCYSGQCNMSAYTTGRSGNRGECAQLCRHKYTLTDANGTILLKDRYILSLKDLNTTEIFKKLLQTGAFSLKIEGRLKDENYVKNTTAHYHQLIELYRKEYNLSRTSSGTIDLFFKPDTERSFNRMHSAYFFEERKNNLSNQITPKSIGKFLGVLSEKKENLIKIDTKEQLSNGDGLCFIYNELIEYTAVNGKKDTWIELKDRISLPQGSRVFRNKDIAFEKTLKNATATRKIKISMLFSQTENNAQLTIIDEDTIQITHICELKNEKTNNKEKLHATIEKQLKKTGDLFLCDSIEIDYNTHIFMSVSEINMIRRLALDALAEKRKKIFIENRKKIRPISKYPLHKSTTLFQENISNHLSAQLYSEYNCQLPINAVECTKKFDNIELMRSKYCIRYEIGICNKLQSNRGNSNNPLYLTDNKNKYIIDFDCINCEMIIKPN